MSRTMPYKRKQPPTSYQPPKRPRKNYLSTVSNAYMRQGLTRELKIVDQTSIGGLGTLGTVTGVLLNGVASGDDYNQRDGRRIAMHSIQINGFVVCDTLTTGSAIARLVVVYDRQTNGNAVTAANYFQLTSDFTSLNNVNNQGRFVTLFDKKYDLDSSAAGTGGRKVHSIELFKFLQNMPVQYQGSSNAVADISSGSLYMFLFSSAASSISGNVYARVKFREM